MNEKIKKKYDELKKKNRITSIQKAWENNVLLQECLESTGGKLLNYDEGNKILEKIQVKIPFRLDGRVDFSKFKSKNNINTIASISELIKNSTEFYVMWDEVNLPCLKSELENIIKFIDDVTAVSFDTWIVSSDYNTIIEFYHDGEITLGILS
ncbi:MULTISPECIES: hypothetical protein [Clostridium]|uniref:CDI toxin immunity protein n=1 Tax=Clostridium TaxID=1485 RepID=UPI00082683FA|nr:MULTISPECIES: hypothetical protein [Clostridium]PJI09338.1 hypothetical protein CUB90_16280 [Clostridium sp. CT7]